MARIVVFACLLVFMLVPISPVFHAQAQQPGTEYREHTPYYDPRYTPGNSTQDNPIPDNNQQQTREKSTAAPSENQHEDQDEDQSQSLDC